MTVRWDPRWPKEGKCCTCLEKGWKGRPSCQPLWSIGRYHIHHLRNHVAGIYRQFCVRLGTAWTIWEALVSTSANTLVENAFQRRQHKSVDMPQRIFHSLCGVQESWLQVRATTEHIPTKTNKQKKTNNKPHPHKKQTKTKQTDRQIKPNKSPSKDPKQNKQKKPKQTPTTNQLKPKTNRKKHTKFLQY